MNAESECSGLMPAILYESEFPPRQLSCMAAKMRDAKVSREGPRPIQLHGHAKTHVILDRVAECECCVYTRMCIHTCATK